jgi:asparagine synthase (glutamine-hydrolysing)
MQDEPFADASLLPTAMVCQLARANVTVALAGDGGDELFGGYSRYARAIRAWELVDRAPDAVRKGLRAATAPLRDLHTRGQLPLGRSRLPKLLRRAQQLGAADLSEIHALTTLATPRPELYVVGATPRATRVLASVPGHPVRQLMLDDYINYLPHDVLVKADRASMASSLELRAPLLDHHIAELALGLPAEWTWADGTGKLALKSLLERYVPRALWDRSKRGFGVPVESWLRGALRPWAEELLDPAILMGAGLWDVRAVRARWDEHQAGSNHDMFLWSVLQVQAWLAADPADGPDGFSAG